MTLDERFTGLEREVVRLRRVVVCMAAGIVAVVVMAADFRGDTSLQASVVTANEFRLLDDSGKVIGTWAQQGAPGTIGRLMGPTLTMNSAGDTVTLGMFELAFHKKGGGIGTETKFFSYYGHRDFSIRNGGIKASVEYSENRRWPWVQEGTALTLRDRDGNDRLVLGTARLVTKRSGDEITSSVGSLHIFDENGNTLEKLPR